MTRSELARLLGAAPGLVTDSGSAATVIEADEPEAASAIISEADPARFMAALADAVAGEGTVFLCDPHWGEREKTQLASVVSSPRSPLPAPGSPRGWLCIPTGGTSGRLKFARHDEETLSAAVRGFTAHFGLKQVNAAGLLPLHHVSGLMAWMRCALTGGEYRPLDWKAIEGGVLPVLPAKADGWVLSLVPTQLERLLRGVGGPVSAPAAFAEPTAPKAAVGRETDPPRDAVEWLRQFRIIFVGGAPAWPALLDRAAALQLPVSLGYGMTETAAMVTALRPEEFLAGVRSNGPALPHAAVQIGTDDTIIIGGASLFRGYHPEWRDGENFETQDRGRLDERRHLNVMGRRDAVIITGGEKVEPGEVEAVLRGSGQLSDVIVLGLPHPQWGQVVVAVYPGVSPPDLARVYAALRGTLAGYKHPKRYIPLGSWPVNEQGKINRAELQRLLEGRTRGKVGG